MRSESEAEVEIGADNKFMNLKVDAGKIKKPSDAQKKSVMFSVGQQEVINLCK